MKFVLAAIYGILALLSVAGLLFSIVGLSTNYTSLSEDTEDFWLSLIWCCIAISVLCYLKYAAQYVFRTQVERIGWKGVLYSILMAMIGGVLIISGMLSLTEKYLSLIGAMLVVCVMGCFYFAKRPKSI